MADTWARKLQKFRGLPVVGAKIAQLLDAGAEDIVTVAAANVTLAALDTTYRVPFTLPAAFANAGWRVAAVACDQAAFIEEDLRGKTAQAGALLVSVVTGAAAGTYGGNLDLTLTLTLAGPKYGGASLDSVVATGWTPE